ncbi:MAG TPA: glucose-6-phosphate dehydrogenase, partial [Stellaceae bacterium]|nr:glucose-6-phosphate dehydrogenase [Stellaceae bacterium]
MDSAQDSPAGRRGRGHRAPPCAMVIFGASGDLTKRLLMPGLYNLARARRLSEKFAVIGIDRSAWSEEDFRANLTEGVRSFVSDTAAGSVAEEFDADSWDLIGSRMSHIDGDATSPEIYSRLARELERVEQEYGTGGNVIFYLAVASSLFGSIVERLAEVGLTAEKDGYWRRIIIEKPFGRDLASARALDAQLLKVVAESQIYRMDHFLGKETVQNI